MGPFGLKWSRFRQWRKAVEDELGGLGWGNRLSLLLEMANVALWAIVGQRRYPERRVMWRRKLKRCRVCPIYDRVNRRCRPYHGSKLGCGCYVPYLALLKDRCWGDVHFSTEGDIGWKIERHPLGTWKV